MSPQKNDLPGEVKRYLESSGIKSILAGVSGGADSIAMASALKCCNINFTVVNCNFHLRGPESERDSRFVEEFCKRNEIRYIHLDFDIEEYIQNHGGSVEMACRELRYSAFRAIRTNEGFDRIAVAHNSDDQAETVLLNLFRGAGVAGLRGMRKDTGEIIRPLLDFSREEIETYLASIGESYVTDSTNKDSRYRRNFLRLEVLPLLRSRWPQVTESILKTASIMESEEKALNYLEGGLIGLGREYLSKEEIINTFDSNWIIRRFVIRHNGTEKIAEEISSCLSAKQWKSGKEWPAKDGKFVTSQHGLEWIDSDNITDPECLSECFEIEEYEMNKETLEKIETSTNDILWSPLPPEELEFRYPEPGDRIRSLGMVGSQKVNKVIKDAKLLKKARMNICIIATKNDGEIIWVEGLKRSRKYQVSGENKIIWRIVRK